MGKVVTIAKDVAVAARTTLLFEPDNMAARHSLDYAEAVLDAQAHPPNYAYADGYEYESSVLATLAAVYAAIQEACGANAEGFARNKDICQITGLSRTTVTFYIKRLRDKGQIELVRLHGLSGYKLPVEKT